MFTRLNPLSYPSADSLARTGVILQFVLKQFSHLEGCQRHNKCALRLCHFKVSGPMAFTCLHQTEFCMTEEFKPFDMWWQLLNT